MHLASTSAPKSSNRCTSCTCGSTIHGLTPPPFGPQFLDCLVVSNWRVLFFFLNKERMKYSHFLYQDRKKLSTLLVQNVIPKTSGRRLVHLDGISAASRSQKRSVALRVAVLLDAPATIPVRQVTVVDPWSVFRASAARLESIQP